VVSQEELLAQAFLANRPWGRRRHSRAVVVNGVRPEDAPRLLVGQGWLIRELCVR
jgi:hypothetical protein